MLNKVTIATLDCFGETIYAVGETKQKAKNAIIDLWEDKYPYYVGAEPTIDAYKDVKCGIQYIEIEMNKAKMYGYE